MTLTVPHRYVPRGYQVSLFQAMDCGFKRAVQVWHRRAGKEKTCLNLLIKKAVERVGTYFYVFPTFVQGRKVLWDGTDKDGLRFIDHIPPQLIESKNDTEMKIRLVNGSLIQIIGSDNYNASMGTNPIGIVFSEYSLQDPGCWNYYRPILAENGGWAIFNFTPRGENHAYAIYELAKADPENWFVSMLTADDTGAIPPEVLKQELKEILRLNGDDSIYQQEYFCSFTVPITGSYYAHQIQKAYADGRVGVVPHEPQLSVDTWWDLGVNDRTSIWFTQTLGREHRVIDYLDGSGFGLPHYVKLLKDKPYVYGIHTAPHDIKVREFGTGKSRMETAEGLGIIFEQAPNIPIVDGIEAVRNLFDRCAFDAKKTADGLNGLKNYRKQWDEKRNCFLNTPYHDWSSNPSDAFRMMAVALDFKHRSLPSNPPDKYHRAQNHTGKTAPPVGILG